MRNGETSRCGAPDGEMRSRQAIINIPRAFRVESTSRGPRLYHQTTGPMPMVSGLYAKIANYCTPRWKYATTRYARARPVRRPISHLITLYARTYGVANCWSMIGLRTCGVVGEPTLFRRSYEADSIMHRNNFARRFISRFYPHTVLDLVVFVVILVVLLVVVVVVVAR